MKMELVYLKLWKDIIVACPIANPNYWPFPFDSHFCVYFTGGFNLRMDISEDVSK
jgi:hypothetical protein